MHSECAVLARFGINCTDILQRPCTQPDVIFPLPAQCITLIAQVHWDFWLTLYNSSFKDVRGADNKNCALFGLIMLP